MKAAKHLSTYILAPRSILDVCSLDPNWCIKTLRKSQPVSLPRARFQSTSRCIRRWRTSLSQSCLFSCADFQTWRLENP